MTELEWAWLAGFIDGDGCIRTWIRDGRRKFGITIAQKDPTQLYWIQERLGGNIAGVRRGTNYQLRWFSREVVRDMIEHMLPYLRVKQEAAQLCLDLI